MIAERKGHSEVARLLKSGVDGVTTPALHRAEVGANDLPEFPNHIED